MASSKWGTRARRWLRQHTSVLAISLLMSAYGGELAFGQSYSFADALRTTGGIAGLMKVCFKDSRGAEKINKALENPKYADFRPWLLDSFKKAMLENIILVNGKEVKLPCDQLQGVGEWADKKEQIQQSWEVTKQGFDTTMDALIKGE